MNAISPIETWPLTTALAPVWLDAALKSVLVLALAGVAVGLMRRSSAAARHLVWFLAVASLLALPFLSLVLPGWRILPRWMEVPPPRAVATPMPDDVRSQAPPSVLRSGPENALPEFPRLELAPPASVGTDRSVRSVLPPPAPARLDFQQMGLLAWLAGAALAFVPTLLGIFSLWRLERGSRPETETSWLDLLRRLVAALSFQRSVALLKSRCRRMPMTWGVLRPKLLLPEESQEWPEERRRVVMLHELAHAKRWDYLTNLVTQGACALYWFNPLVWIAARRMIAERERACDDIVLRHGAKPADYAEQVLEIAARLPVGRFAGLGAIPMARPSKLEGRLRAILDGQRNRAALTRVVVIAALALLAAIVVPVAMMKAAPAADTANRNGMQSDVVVWQAIVPGELVRQLDLTNGFGNQNSYNAYARDGYALRRALHDALRDGADIEAGEKLQWLTPRDSLFSALGPFDILSNVQRQESPEITVQTATMLCNGFGQFEPKGTNVALNLQFTVNGQLQRLKPDRSAFEFVETKPPHASVEWRSNVPAGKTLCFVARLAGTLDGDFYHLAAFETIRTFTNNAARNREITRPLQWLGRRLPEPLPGNGPEEVLDLKYKELTPEDLERIASKPRLKRLHLTYSSITDDGLRSLAGLKDLEWLDLSRTSSDQRPRLTDAGLIHLTGLTRLRTLQLHGHAITDAGLEQLAGLPKLEALQLGATRVTGEALRHFTNLTWLRLDSTPLNEEGLRRLGKLISLDQLYLGGTSVSDAGLAHLHSLKMLQSLSLYNTQVTPAGVEALKQALPGLSVDYSASPSSSSRREEAQTERRSEEAGEETLRSEIRWSALVAVGEIVSEPVEAPIEGTNLVTSRFDFKLGEVLKGTAPDEGTIPAGVYLRQVAGAPPRLKKGDRRVLFLNPQGKWLAGEKRTWWGRYPESEMPSANAERIATLKRLVATLPEPVPGAVQLARLMERHLPGYSLRTGEILATPAGEEIDLAAAREPWRGVGDVLPPVGSARFRSLDAAYMRNPNLTALAPSLNLKVATPQDAEEVARVMFGLFMGWTSFENWTTKAALSENGWVVTPEYVGPPSQVRYLGPVELIVEDGTLKDVRQGAGMPPRRASLEIKDTNAAEPGWGEAVEGLSVRLQSDKEVWYLASDAPALRLSVRNLGGEALAVPESEELGELEVDGVWHTWSDKYFVAHKPLAPGRQMDNLAVFASNPTWRKDSTSLFAGAGKHRVRFAVTARRGTSKSGPTIRAVSNPVEVEFRMGVAPKEAAAPATNAPASNSPSATANPARTNPQSSESLVISAATARSLLGASAGPRDFRCTLVDDEAGSAITNFWLQAGVVNPQKPDDITWSTNYQGPILTDAQGRFALHRESTAQAWRILAKGFLPQTIGTQESGELVVRLTRADDLAGIVVDYSGRPVVDARVSVTNSQVQIASGAAEFFKNNSTRTDAAGRFTLPRPAAAELNLTVITRDEQMIQTVPVSTTSQDLKITLPQPAALIVHYDIPGDVEACGIRMTLRMPIRGAYFFDVRSTVTNRGQVALTNLTPGSYLFAREKPMQPGADPRSRGMPVEDFRLTLEAGQTQRVDLVRTSGYRVRGIVSGLEPAGISSGRVVVRTGERNEQGIDYAYFGTDGQFQTALIEPGTYNFSVTASSDAARATATNNLQRATLHQYSASTTVTVTPDAAPPSVKLQLRPWDDPVNVSNRLAAQIRANANRPTPPSLPASVQQRLNADALSGLLARGIVVDDASGTPLVDFVVQRGRTNVTNPGEIYWDHYMMGSPLVQPAGRWSVRLENWDRSVRILAPGHVPQVFSKESLAGFSSSDIEVLLKRGDSIQGVVLDADSQPVAGARLYLATTQRVYLMDGKTEYGEFRGDTTTTDNTGRFALRGEGGASQKIVVATADNHLVWPVAHTNSTQEMRIVLPRTGTLIVRYDIPGDLPEAKPELRLIATNKDQTLWKDLSFGLSFTVTNGGETVLTNLTPGTYNFRWWRQTEGGPGTETDRQLVQLEAGQTQRVDLVRTGGQRIRGRVLGLDLAKTNGGFILVRSPEATGQPWPQRSRNYEKEFRLANYGVSEFAPDGTFETAMLKPGTYSVIAHVHPPGEGNQRPGVGVYRNSNPDFVGVTQVTVGTQALPPVTVPLAPALFVDIVGSVVDEETGASLRDYVWQSSTVDGGKTNEITWPQGFSGPGDSGQLHLSNARDNQAWRILANGYLPAILTRREIVASRQTANLQVRLKRGGEVHGMVIDHAGWPVAGANVFLAPVDLGYVRLRWVMSSSSSMGGVTRGVTNWAHTFATTDAAGRFSFRGMSGGQQRLIAVSADGQLVQPLLASASGQELKITLPKPASLIVRYDIPGDQAQAGFRLQLRTNEMEMPLWRYVGLTPFADVTNGGQVVVNNLTPGVYDFSRSRFGGTTNSGYAFLFGAPAKFISTDLQRVLLESGRTQEVSVVRKVGQHVQGEVTGLGQATNVFGRFVYVASAGAISRPSDFEGKLEPCFDAASFDQDGHFQTALLEPGDYTLVAEVFVWGEVKHEYADDEPRYGGMIFARPQELAYVGSAKVTVTADAAPEPVRIVLRSRASPTDRPTTQPSSRGSDEPPVERQKAEGGTQDGAQELKSKSSSKPQSAMASPARTNAQSSESLVTPAATNDNPVPGKVQLTELVRKYLPGYSYQEVTNSVPLDVGSTQPGTLTPVIVTPEGKQIPRIQFIGIGIAGRDSGFGKPPGEPSPPYRFFGEIMDLFGPLRLRVSSAQEAEDITKLVMGLRDGTHSLETFVVKAEPLGQNWLVTPSYANPAAEVWSGDIFELALEDGVLQEIRQRSRRRAEEDQAERRRWGESVEGVRVRLHAQQTRWGTNEQLQLLVDIAIRGATRFAFSTNYVRWDLEVDGRRYTTLSDQYLIPEGLNPGQTLTNLPFTVGSKRDPQLLQLVPGKHILRLRISSLPGLTLNPNVAPFRSWPVFSNPLEIEISDGPKTGSDQHEPTPSSNPPSAPASPARTNAQSSASLVTPAATNDPTRPFVVTGRVTDDRGNGLEGVTVAAHCGVGSLQPTGETKSDAEGRYTLRFRQGMTTQRDGQSVVGVQAATINPDKPGFFETNLHRGGDLLMADKLPAPREDTGWKVDPAKLVLPNKPFELNFVMRPAATVVGQLLDERGQPAAERRLWINGAQLPPSCNVLAGAQTDGEGRFRFDNVPTGFTWRFNLADNLWAETQFDQAGEQKVGLRLVLGNAGAASQLQLTRGAAQPSPPRDGRSTVEETARRSFGPVIEREMKPPTGLERSYLDLETGDFVTNSPPGDVTLLLGESDSRVRHGLNMAAVAVSSNRWDATAEEVVTALANQTNQAQVRLGGPESRRTWFFRTREGSTGVLRIEPDASGAVRIRWRLIAADRPGSSRRE